MASILLVPHRVLDEPDRGDRHRVPRRADVSGEVGSGQALAILARPVRRSQVPLGKWLGLAAFGCGYVVTAGLAQFLVVRATVGYWPPQPALGLAVLAAETVVLLTLALLLSSVVSPMASGIVAVGPFGATWVAGIVGAVGGALATRASSGWAPCRGSCSPPTACGGGR